MKQFVKGIWKLFELGSSPAIVTGVGLVYCKNDGHLYFKNDAGEETQLTGQEASAAAGVNEVQWGPFELESDDAVVGAGFASVTLPALPLTNSGANPLNTPLFRIPAGAVDEIDNGAVHKIEVAVQCLTATGNAVLYSRWYRHRIANNAIESQLESQVVSITADQVKVVEFTWDKAVADGDSMYFYLGRNSSDAPGVIIDGSSSTNDTLNGRLDVLWIRYSTTEAPSS